MLPEMQLDIDNFEDIVLRYRNMISSIYPEWTDYNYHDPGITMVELFAWLKEIQQFHLDQIGEEHQNKYLKLLGMTRNYKTPACAFAEVKSSQTRSLRPGTKFYADQFCFETECEEILIGKNILQCITVGSEQMTDIDERQLNYGGKMSLYPFGQTPAAGNCCYFRLDLPLPVEMNLNLSVRIFQNYPVKRNPVTKQTTGFYPLADISYEYYCKEGWKQVKLIQDETYQLIQDGRITFKIETPMTQTVRFHSSGYYIRFRLVSTCYEVAPNITGISFNEVKTVQKDTSCASLDIPVSFSKERTGTIRISHSLAKKGKEELYYQYKNSFLPIQQYKKEEQLNETIYHIEKTEEAEINSIRIVCYTNNFWKNRVLAYGNGFPGQTYLLNQNDVFYEDFELMAEDAEKPGVFYSWTKVDDFDLSSPEDRHYRLNEEEKKVLFGNSIHGLAPEGKIIIIGCASSAGKAGNVKAGKINRCEELEGYDILNSQDAWGGTNQESISESFLRARKMLRTQERAVTEQDYETLVYQVPGLMLRSCKAAALSAELDSDIKNGENAVGILAMPYSDAGAAQLNKAYYNNIMGYLDSRRLLGVKVKIYPPEYIETEVYGEIKINAQFRDAKESVEQQIKQFFREQEREFGKPVLFGKLYGRIDSLSCVKEIGNLVIEAKGNRVRKTQNGDMIPPPNGVFLLKNVDCTITSA